MAKTILVLGATGQQGGAVVRRLRADDWAVRGFVRDVDAPAARALAELGVELSTGDLADRASVARALEGMYGVFSVQTPANGIEMETVHGTMVADAAGAAGVQHFVYSSVGGAERDSGIPHFESKWRVEQHLGNTDLPVTVLRPVFFMDNFVKFMRPSGEPLTITMGMQPDKPLQMIAVEDIGAFAALAFADPQRYVGQSVEIAGDELTLKQIAQTYSRVWGKPVESRSLPTGMLRQQDEEMGIMFEWFNTDGYAADIPALREAYPALLTFEQWLRKTDATA